MARERKYTGRDAYLKFVKTGFTEEEAADASRDSGTGARLHFASCWARKTLERHNMPLEVSAPIYSDPDWRQHNERRSPEWYAIEMLRAVGSLTDMLKEDNAPFAAVFAWRLAWLLSEARFLNYITANASKGGAAKALERESVLRQRDAGWREEAVKLWTRHPSWSATAIAKLIDPARERTIRRVIADLNPNC
jgi:hypothetical protein